MTIFGDGNISRNITAHNATSLDTAMNYTYGTLLLVAIPIALTLNPVVFYYNRKQKLTLATGLFQTLSLLDFTFTLRSIVTAYNLLKPQQDHLYILNPNAWKKFQALFAYSVGYSAMFATLLMGIVRYVKIRAPFWALRHKRMITMVTITALVVDLVYNIIVSSLVFIDTSPKYAWFSAIQSIVKVFDNTAKVEQYLMINIPFYIKIGLSVIFSFLTVLHLRSEKGQQLPEVKRRSIIMIVLLNLGNVVWFLLCVAANIITEFSDFVFDYDNDDHWSYWFLYLNFMDSVLMQCLLGAYNPLVFCLRNSGIRGMVRTLRTTWKVEVHSTCATTSQSTADDDSRVPYSRF